MDTHDHHDEGIVVPYNPEPVELDRSGPPPEPPPVVEPVLDEEPEPDSVEPAEEPPVPEPDVFFPLSSQDEDS